MCKFASVKNVFALNKRFCKTNKNGGKRFNLRPLSLGDGN